MTSRWQSSLWFAVPFGLVLVVILGLRLESSNRSRPQPVDNVLRVSAATALVGQTLPASGLFEAHSRTPIAEQGLTLPDTAVVILLGGIGCSANQVELLRYWSEDHDDTGTQNYPVLALYADPLLGVEQGAYESLLLRRVSQAKFPFLVSQDPDFNLRAMGIRTPQVVLAESQVITHVFNPSAALNPPVLPRAVH